MKKSLVLLLVVCVVFALVGCGGGTTGSTGEESKEEEAEPIVLKFGTHLTDNHVLVENAVKPWMDRVTELTNGQVTFEYYGNSQMGKATDAHNLVKSGVLDVAYTLYMTTDLPIMDLPMLPNLYDAAECDKATRAYWDVMKGETMSTMLADYGLKPVIALCWGEYSITTTTETPMSMDDFAKLKLRSSGGVHDQAAAALGITPVSISASETLEALTKGTVDGAWGSVTSWTDYQYTQVTKHGIRNIPLNGWGGIFAMNIDLYNSLPENVQKAIDQADDEIVDQLATNLKAICDQGWIDAENAGVELYDLPEDVCNQIKEALEPITQEWLNTQDAAGVPATQVYNEFKDALAKY